MGKSGKYTDNQIKWLKKYTDAELRSVREAVGKVEGTNKEAVDKVETNNTHYRESQNEWRGQIKDQTTTFVTRRELWAAVITIITITISAVALFLKK